MATTAPAQDAVLQASRLRLGALPRGAAAQPLRAAAGGGRRRRRGRAAAPPRVAAYADTQQHHPAAPADGDATVVCDRSWPLPGGAAVRVLVTAAPSGELTVSVTTDRPGGDRMVLHWGVEGGAGWRGGWRLPGAAARPPGTVEYKKRALQTPFAALPGGAGAGVRLVLPPGEASDALNFVLKDDASGDWFDLNGGNFSAPLRPELAAAEAAARDASSEDDEAPLLPAGAVPPLPQELAGTWAYMRWEAAGCPARSQAESDGEYAAALAELATLLRRGVPLDELRGVAGAGVERYKAFVAPFAAMAARAAARAARNGGAAAVAAPPAPRQEQQQEPQQQELPLPPPPPAAAEPPPPAVYTVGESSGALRPVNALDLVNAPAPPRGGAAAAAPPPRLAERDAYEAALAPLAAAYGADERVVWSRTYRLGDRAELLVGVRQEDPSNPDSPVEVVATTDLASPAVLHWGVRRPGRRGGDWAPPPAALVPPGSAPPAAVAGGKAAETPMADCDDDECALLPLRRARLALPAGHGLAGLAFVLRSEDGTRWWNDGGSNFAVPVPGAAAAAAAAAVRPELAGVVADDVARTIIDAEVNSGGWTLMHRFNKAAELIDAVVEGRAGGADPGAAMARIFVWLRFSATRQLTWQRNYNTQPRILGAAQERLTRSVARAAGALAGPARAWARAGLGTVGRGGNAQAVRDEILNIMHRNKISEVKGTWMEEWHQKLHNNTTPDDVPICEAYLAFLRADGDLAAYWRVLSDAGISRARLEGFDRPVVTDPAFYPGKKDALIADFEAYLKILKGVHSGADLQASAAAAAPHVPAAAKPHLGFVLSRAGDAAVLPVVEAAVEARTALRAALAGGDPNRELLYLDLALEDVVRAAAERGAAASGAAAAALIGPLLQNLALSAADNAEACYCLKAWAELPPEARGGGGRPGREAALRAMAVIDRVRRALAAASDAVVAELGPLAEAMGGAFGCEPWAVSLFAEEVVRGGPAFAVSLAVSAAEPALRAAAELGAWQLISPVGAAGRLVVVPDLYSVQDVTYAEPTVLLARRVSGEEEPPAGCAGVVSGDAPDVLSHLSVRCRNMGVMFAACYDAAELDALARLDGAAVEFQTTAAGAVTWREAAGGAAASGAGGAAAAAAPPPKTIRVDVPAWCGKWALRQDEFRPGAVGAKSANLAALRGRLPEWVRLPASVTVPFGAFEEALKRKENAAAAAALRAAVAEAAGAPGAPGAALARARAAAAAVTLPPEGQAALKDAMAAAGIPVPADPGRWDAAMAALRAVWASKYSDRAALSTKKVGIAFDDVRMAVLAQRVVPAAYAFVIHTTNPTTGDAREIYAELVAGLGEAIVGGTVPGTALAFAAAKLEGGGVGDPRVVLFPSKSAGLFVPESLIFRSDSSGEDLEGYAGAGLYDSVTLDAMESRVVDYSADPVVADEGFRNALMRRVAEVGLAVEAACGGAAQDVEGVVGPDGEITVVQTRPQM